MAVLDRELETYEKNRERLLSEYEGKYVLIHGDEVVGAYDTELDAIRLGYQKFGNVPMLVKRVVEVETPEYLVSGYLNF
jgi:hypothetical protein